MNRIFHIVLFSVLSVSLSAQTLSLDQTIRVAQDSAIAAYQSQNALLRAQWQHEQFLASRRFQLSFVLDPGYQKISTEPFSHYYKLRDYNMLNTYAELRLEKQASSIGGNFYASTGAMWTEFFGNSSTVPRQFSTVPVGVGYSNSLIGYNPYKWEKAINDYHIESERKEYLYSLEGIALEAVKLYMDCLVAQSQFEICSVNAEVAKRMFEIGKEKFEIAALSKNEICALELQSVNAENSLFNAEQDMDDAREKFLSYLRIADEGQELKLVTPDIPQKKNILLEDAVRLAKENNPEYRKSREEILSAEQKADKAKVQAGFLQTSLDLNLGLQNYDPNFGTAYSGQRPFVMGNVTLRIPIFDGGLARSRSKAAEYDLAYARDSENESARRLELEVTVALREFNNQQELLVRTSNVLTLADESFALAEELYSNGETDINTLVIAQNRKDEAHSNYLKSLKSYWVSYYNLMALCVSEF